MADQVDTLPMYERIVFKESPLELCLLQVKYPSVSGFPDEGAVTQLRRAFKAGYPHFRNEHTTNLVITPQGVQHSQGTAIWRFDDLARRWSVVIAEDNVTVETRRYGGFDELVERTLSAVEIVGRVLEVTYQTRVGLRYINEIRHPQGEAYDTWRRLLAPDLLGPSRDDLLGGEVEQTIAEARVRRPDGSLLVRHGFLRGSTIAPSDGSPPQQSSFYLLDTDYFNEEASEYGSDLVERLTAYHSVMYRIFRWAIGDGDLYSFFGPIL